VELSLIKPIYSSPSVRHICICKKSLHIQCNAVSIASLKKLS
jgi:hypothetical protein